MIVAGWLPGCSAKILKSYDDFMDGETTLFVEPLKTFVGKDLLDTSEVNLEMGIELLWFEETQCVPQIRLLRTPTNPRERDAMHSISPSAIRDGIVS